MVERHEQVAWEQGSGDGMEQRRDGAVALACEGVSGGRADSRCCGDCWLPRTRPGGGCRCRPTWRECCSTRGGIALTGSWASNRVGGDRSSIVHRVWYFGDVMAQLDVDDGAQALPVAR